MIEQSFFVLPVKNSVKLKPYTLINAPMKWQFWSKWPINLAVQISILNQAVGRVLARSQNCFLMIHRSLVQPLQHSSNWEPQMRKPLTYTMAKFVTKLTKLARFPRFFFSKMSKSIATQPKFTQHQKTKLICWHCVKVIVREQTTYNMATLVKMPETGPVFSSFTAKKTTEKLWHRYHENWKLREFFLAGSWILHSTCP